MVDIAGTVRGWVDALREREPEALAVGAGLLTVVLVDLFAVAGGVRYPLTTFASIPAGFVVLLIVSRWLTGDWFPGTGDDEESDAVEK